MSKFELLAAMQACMIYLTMYVIDYSPEDEGNARDLLLALHASSIFSSFSVSVTNRVDRSSTRRSKWSAVAAPNRARSRQRVRYGKTGSSPSLNEGNNAMQSVSSPW